MPSTIRSSDRKCTQVKTAVVHLADALIKASGFVFSGDQLVLRIQPAAWKRLGLNEYLLAGIISEVENKLVEVKNFSMEIQLNGKTKT